MATDNPRLIADIGGTNARFALLRAGSYTPVAERVLACKDYPDLAAAAEAYLADKDGPRPREAAIDLATAITGDRVSLTNNPWSFSLEETRKRLGLDRLLALNDFTALALALPYLSAADLVKIGGGEPLSGMPMALLGSGTGLGVSGMIPADRGWIPLEGEGGHVTFSPANEREIEVLRVISKRFEHVSAERLLNGAGLVHVYSAIAELVGAKPEYSEPAEVTEKGLAGQCPFCREALELFCAMLGTVAGNLALTLGARGGVYIGGGIVPRLGEFFLSSPFRKRFEHKGRFSAYLAAVPSYVITAGLPAFIGLARVFDNPQFANR